MIKVFHIVSIIAICLIIVTSCIDNRTDEERLADYIVEQTSEIAPQLHNIEKLISLYGKAPTFPSDKAIGNGTFSGTVAKMFGASDNYNRILKMLKDDMEAYNQLKPELSDKSKQYGISNTMFYFCNDTINPRRNDMLDKLLIEEKPFSVLRNRETILDLIHNQQDSLYIYDINEKYHNMLDYLKDIKYIVFISYDCALFPHAWLGDITKGAIRAKADVYQIHDKSLIKSIKVYAESSDSIKGFILEQRHLDEDIQNNLGMQVIRILSKDGMELIEKDVEEDDFN